MMQAPDVARQIINTVETPDNFNVNDIVFRPLQVK
jgi:NADP-dependent 3-hydroxy acid dehydrogenase YdfG